MDAVSVFVFPVALVLVAIALVWAYSRARRGEASSWDRSLTWKVGIFVLALAAVAAYVFFLQPPGGEEIAYGGSPRSFLSYVREGKVDRVVQEGAALKVILVDGQVFRSHVPSEISTNVRSDIEDVCAELGARCPPGKPEISAAAPSQTGQLLTLLLTAILPVVVIGAIFFVALRQVRWSGSPTGMGLSKATARERLEELERLRSGGLISEDEYAAKRRQILDEL